VTGESLYICTAKDSVGHRHLYLPYQQGSINVTPLVE
jgi:hypothetical protein